MCLIEFHKFSQLLEDLLAISGIILQRAYNYVIKSSIPAKEQIMENVERISLTDVVTGGKSGN